MTGQKSYDNANDGKKNLKEYGVKEKRYVIGEGELRNKHKKKSNRLGLKDDFMLLGAKTNP